MIRHLQTRVWTPEFLAWLGAQVLIYQGLDLVQVPLRPTMELAWVIQPGKQRAAVLVEDAPTKDEAWQAMFETGGVENPAVNLLVAHQLVSELTVRINLARTTYVEVDGVRVDIDDRTPQDMAAGLVLAWWESRQVQ